MYMKKNIHIFSASRFGTTTIAKGLEGNIKRFNLGVKIYEY